MNNIKKLRDMYDFTVRDVDASTNVNYGQLSRLEKTTGSANYSTVTKIASFYDVTGEYLMGESDIGFIVVYEYDGMESDRVAISESEFIKAKEKHCLWDEITPTKIHHHIRGSIAKVYFDTMQVPSALREVLWKYQALPKDKQNEIKKKLELAMMKLEVEEMQKQIDEMESSDVQTEKKKQA